MTPTWCGCFAVLAALVVGCLGCVEVAKAFFYRVVPTARVVPLRRTPTHRIHRIANPWSHHRSLPEEGPAARAAPVPVGSAAAGGSSGSGPPG